MVQLPFVRFDKSAVPREVFHEEEVSLDFAYTEGVGLDAGGGNIFVVERVQGWAKVVDGDDVLLRSAETGLYLQSRDDSTPLDMAERDDSQLHQRFKIFKQGRPTFVGHRNIVYLQTWLSNYVELAEDGTLRAYRWRRGEPQTLSLLKRKVLESSTTEVARRMQFQAFDLDGNGSISRGEMEYMITQVRGGISSEELDAIMGQVDPAQTGGAPFAAFAAWADAGGLGEEQLQHAEVLGNVAQRCNDCLKEEGALIEVLTTTQLNCCQQMKAKHNEMFECDLTESLVQKASEQDGWIFSNYWKLAMRALLEDEVDLWTRSLNDAMRGFGTDEDTLTTLVCTMPERLRFQIFRRYKEQFGKGLLEHIQSEVSFNYKKVLVFQAMSPADCRAKILNGAMAGLGTSEDQLIRVICLADLGERRAIKESYQRMFGRDLVEHVRSETSGDFQKALLCMLEAEEAPFNLDDDCAAMKKAMDGWGTDEAALISLICAKTPLQMEIVNDRFEELYGKKLLTRVKNETSGNFQETMMGAIRHPMDQLAHSVRYCIKGWGTDDTGLITLLVHLPDFKKDALRQKYQKLFDRDLIKDIKGDTSGDYQKALCALVKPAPEVWADALMGAMKGLGTSDELLINTLVIAKDEMTAVRRAFRQQHGKSLPQWIDGECGGDYKKTLIALCMRNSEDEISLLPVYWTQRCRDALTDIDTIKDILVSLPTVAIKRGTEIFHAVYGMDLAKEIEAKCKENSSFFSFSNYWKTTMLSLLDMPVERWVRGLNDAMRGWGTDEFTLTGLVCTMPPNMRDDIAALYEKKYGKELSKHIESETSFNYKKVLVYQTLPFAQSRAKALHGAMAGWGTSEDQLIRVIVLSSMKERQCIVEAYTQMYNRSLIEHIESETSGNFKNIMVAVLESSGIETYDVDYEADCAALKEAMEGVGTDEDAIIRIIAGKSAGQIEALKIKFEELYGRNLFEWIDDETWDWGAGMFLSANFRAALLGLLRDPAEQLAYSVRDCINGWGTDDTGLITCLVHLTERKRRELVETYKTIKGGGDLYRKIVGDTSGDYQRALLALVKPPPVVWAEALKGAMAGLGTSDELLINWMLISKDRMDEVRDAFREQNGQELSEWIAGDCSGDYADTLIRLSNRHCYAFAGSEVGLTVQPPPTREEAVIRFNKCWNQNIKVKRQRPDEILVPSEESQQEMGCAYLWFSKGSSCAPNLDRAGLWEMTNAIGFPPADDGPDLDQTFLEWDYSGTGEITWNDFVREMGTRINDPNHFEADLLREHP